MHNLVLPAPPPNMDSFAPEFCFCGRKTVESHEFWFCSTECARQDSLRSLYDPECHYRNVVRKAYVQAVVPGHYPRRMMSVDQLRAGPSEQRGFANIPARVPPQTNPSYRRNVTHVRRDAPNQNVAGSPTLSQVTDNVLIRKATAGEPLVVHQRHDRPRFQGFPNAPSRANPIQNPCDHTFQQVSLDAIPFPEHVPARPLRHVPPSSDNLRTNIKKSVAALLNVGKSRKGKEDENPERIFGYPANTITPPGRKGSLHAAAVQGSTALRRSASCAGWAHSGPSDERDTVMHVIKEMREGCTESFDPRSLFDLEEIY